jgi:hypothetical protein
MKKRDFASVALILLSAGLLIGACQQKTNGQPGTQAVPEQQAFYNALSPDNQKKFNELDDASKRAAVDAANKDSNHDANKAVEAQYKHFKK